MAKSRRSKRIRSVKRFATPKLAIVVGIMSLVGWFFIAKSLAAGSAPVRFAIFCPTDACYGSVSSLNTQAHQVQAWYKAQTGGRTFSLISTTSIRGSHPTSYYLACNQGIPCVEPGTLAQVWQNIYADPGLVQSDKKSVYLLSFSTPKYAGEGGGNLAILDPDTGPAILGGYAHELGHTFNLPHNNSDTSDQMYPILQNCAPTLSCHLTSGEIATIERTAWFVADGSGTTTTTTSGGGGTGGSSGPSGYTYCAREGGTCSYSGSRSVGYGANGHFTYKTISNGTACNNTVFGDPAVGVTKSCYTKATSTVTEDSEKHQWIGCAREEGTCSFSGTHWVILGDPYTGRWSRQKQATNGIACNIRVFGDPAVGITKFCYYYN